ncbi:MAG: ribonuclease E/G [Azospirillaceae bacterium]|nr:ribonuclease E/G [Azospirillaceae bacterium]
MIEVLIDRRGPLLCALAVEAGEIGLLQVDHTDRPSLFGSIHRGRVQRIVAGMSAAIVEIDTGVGLLGLGDIRSPEGRLRRADGVAPRIGQALRPGQPVLVQVKADGVGAKGPVLTMDITLPGRFLVRAPRASGIVLSRRLAQGDAKTRLRRQIEQIVTGGGWIVRAGAAAADPAVLAAEAEALELAWHAIEGAAMAGDAICRLCDGPAAPQRLLLDLGVRRPTAIRVGSSVGDADLRAWCQDQAIDLVSVLVPAEPSVIERIDFDGLLAGLLRRVVPLSGGGWLAIDRTEALTVIDVNGGERPQPVEVNLAAAVEIARQLRLRNIAGIIIVDFINLAKPAERQYLLERFASACADDAAATDIYGMSRLGLVEMTRARRGPPLSDLLEGADLP